MAASCLNPTFRKEMGSLVDIVCGASVTGPTVAPHAMNFDSSDSA